ncbi:hypothetical protein D9613_001083 [Agrocybe pediades]|uniref:BTB domain-containing protein n=1 Tax=Agrocybe pediades TaxID=84607 RepID=A0A8H4R137_9AGAR|nr:hypothetical protein D9613_001083 [Agrocybe pediades]
MFGENSAFSGLNLDTEGSSSTNKREPEQEKPGASPWGSLALTKSPVAASKLDAVFNFQIIVFQVEDTVFEVLKAGFNVPGSIFETMFSLPQGSPEEGSGVEGSSRDHPIFLPGVTASEFHIFLRVLYPFMNQSDVTEYDEWLSVLRLATMWDFKKIRSRAITHLNYHPFLTQKSAAEKISIGRQYRVTRWIKDGYETLCQDPPQDLGETNGPSEPFGLDWETIAKIYIVREKMRREYTGRYHCKPCRTEFGRQHESGSTFACRCRYATAILEVFKSELSAMNEADSSLDTPPMAPSPMHMFGGWGQTFGEEEGRESP